MQFVKQKKELMLNKSISSSQRAKLLKNISVSDSHIEDLCLDFTLPGFPSIELKLNGKSIDVDLSNLEEYIQLVCDFTAGSGVKKQIDAFRKGMNSVFKVSDLVSFSPQELRLLFGENQAEDWSCEGTLLIINIVAIMDCIKPDHGESSTIQNLVLMMSGFTQQQRRDFLQFISGSVRLPYGGFRAIAPLTVVCKSVEGGRGPDEYLPSVMTCASYLKVPDYSSLEVMKVRFGVACEEGMGSFHLS
jgi:E3 ubiquitin-protein ligase TRIP12